MLPIGKGGWLLNSDSVGIEACWGMAAQCDHDIADRNPFSVSAADFSQTGGNHAAYANCVANPYAGARRRTEPKSQRHSASLPDVLLA